VNVDHVADDVVVSIEQGDVLSDEHVMIAARRGRQLTKQIARRGVHLPLHLPVQSLTGLETALLLGRELIPRSEARRRIGLMLFVVIIDDLPVVVVELLVVSTLSRKTSGKKERYGERCCRKMSCFHLGEILQLNFSLADCTRCAAMTMSWPEM
jgi:hypothetical protein